MRASAHVIDWPVPQKGARFATPRRGSGVCGATPREKRKPTNTKPALRVRAPAEGG